MTLVHTTLLTIWFFFIFLFFYCDWLIFFLSCSAVKRKKKLKLNNAIRWLLIKWQHTALDPAAVIYVTLKTGSIIFTIQFFTIFSAFLLDCSPRPFQFLLSIFMKLTWFYLIVLSFRKIQRVDRSLRRLKGCMFSHHSHVLGGHLGTSITNSDLTKRKKELYVFFLILNHFKYNAC